MGDYLNGMAIDQPAGTSRHNAHAADSWLEPWLIKHVSFYRKHMTKDGKAESHATRRHSAISEALKSRENSIAVPQDHEAQVAGTVPAAAAAPAPVEGQARDSVESESHSEAEAAAPAGEATMATTESKKHKSLYDWRRNVGWMPHP